MMVEFDSLSINTCILTFSTTKTRLDEVSHWNLSAHTYIKTNIIVVVLQALLPHVVNCALIHYLLLYNIILLLHSGDE